MVVVPSSKTWSEPSCLIKWKWNNPRVFIYSFLSLFFRLFFRLLQSLLMHPKFAGFYGNFDLFFWSKAMHLPSFRPFLLLTVKAKFHFLLSKLKFWLVLFAFEGFFNSLIAHAFYFFYPNTSLSSNFISLLKRSLTWGVNYSRSC